MDDAKADPIIQLTCDYVLAYRRAWSRISARIEKLKSEFSSEAEYEAYLDSADWDAEWMGYFEEAYEVREPLLREIRSSTRHKIGPSTIKDPMWDLEVGESNLAKLLDGVDSARSVPDRTEAEVREFGRDIGTQILDWIENISAIDWISFVPMERLFERFPAYTDFGPFQVINAGSDRQDFDEILNNFVALLDTSCGVTFHPPSEVTESPYRENARAFSEKTNWYIPGRPLLALKLRRGEAAPNAALLRAQLKSYLPLIRVCQIGIEIGYVQMQRVESVEERRVGTRWSREDLTRSVIANAELKSYSSAKFYPLMPDRKTRMSPGYMQLPPVALAMNRFTGGHASLMQLDEWRERSERGRPFAKIFSSKAEPPSLSLQTFETDYGEPYAYDTFMEAWNEIAQPVLALRKSQPSEKPQRKALNRYQETIDGAIELVAKCRYEPSSLLHSCVIGTETLLNPFSDTSNLSERFALFVASLTESDPKRRQEKYGTAKRLYGLRSKAVHSSRTGGRQRSGGLTPKDEIPDELVAFEIFVDCLKGIVKWVQGRVDRNEPLDGPSFKEFYLETLFSDAN